MKLRDFVMLFLGALAMIVIFATLNFNARIVSLEAFRAEIINGLRGQRAQQAQPTQRPPQPAQEKEKEKK
jgi:hypothetical protein